MNIHNLKLLLLFLDNVLLCTNDNTTQRLIIDELYNIIIDIFNTLLHIIKLSMLKIDNNKDSNNDDNNIYIDVINKGLSVVELLSTIKGNNNINIKDYILKNHNPCIR